MKTKKSSHHSPSCSKYYLFITYIILLIAVSGCGWLAGPPPQDIEADAFMQRWAGHNSALKQAKGLMRIQVETSGPSISGRAAWAANFPDQVRIELLSFLGQPLMKFAANGKAIVVAVAGEEEPYRVKQRSGALEKIVHIPIGVEDLLNIMKGVPPEVTYTAAQMRYGEGGEKRVVLLNRWHQKVAEFKAMDGSQIQEMAAFDGEDRPLYRISWKSWIEIKGYTVPKEIEVTTGGGERLSLEVDRLFPDEPVSKELFEIDNNRPS